MKVLFTPIGVLAGLAAGFAAQKGFDRIWAALDEHEAPEPEDREVSYPKLVAALMIEDPDGLAGQLDRLVPGRA